MQKSVAFPPPLKSSNALLNPHKEYPGFLSNFDSALNWDGALPTVTVAHRIETIDKERDAYSKLVAIALSVQDQIGSAFSNSTAGVRNEIEGRISSAVDTHPFNKLEGALKKKFIIVELLQRIRLNRSWYEADAFFGIDALSLDSMESAELFAAYVDSVEHDAERLGLYESFLISLTAAYVKRILVEAVSILDDASLSIDAEIHSALARGETAYSFNLTLSQSAQLVTVAGAATLQNADGWTFEAAIRKGILLLTGLGEALLSRATAIGIGTLLYSPALGNGERYPQTVLKLSGSAVLPDAPTNLNEIAAVEGTIDLPYRIYGDLGQYTLVATPSGGSISPAVPVRALEFDQKTTVSPPPTHRPSPSVFPLSIGKAVRQLHLLGQWRYPITLALSCCHYSCSPKHCLRSSHRTSGIVFTAFRSTAACRRFTLFSIALMKGLPREESTAVDFSILPKLEAQSWIWIGPMLP